MKLEKSKHVHIVIKLGLFNQIIVFSFQGITTRATSLLKATHIEQMKLKNLRFTINLRLLYCSHTKTLATKIWQTI